MGGCACACKGSGEGEGEGLGLGSDWGERSSPPTQPASFSVKGVVGKMSS